jgi:hypothetical protein
VIAPNTNVKTYSITVDQPAPAAPPAKPAAPDLISADDSCLLKFGLPVVTGTNDDCDPNSGTNRDDNFTNVTTPRFQIAPPGAGQTASIYVDGVKAQDATFNQATNIFTLTTPLPGNNNGIEHSITSTVTNTATNLESDQSDPLTVIISTGQSGT